MAELLRLFIISIACIFNRIHDLHITGAAADVIVDRLADFFAARMVILHKQRVSGHDHARNAVTALNCTAIDERLLQRMDIAVFAMQPFNGQNLLAIDLFELSAASALRFAVHQYDACTANTDVTAVFCPGQIEIIANELQQLVVCTRIVHNMLYAIYVDFHGIFPMYV